MKSLKDLLLKTEYRSPEDRLIEAFYIPCLSASQRYWRGVGYFTSEGLASVGKGLAALIENGGCMRLVASPFFTDEDVEALIRGYEGRESIVERALLREVNWDRLSVSDSRRHRLDCISWLVAEGRLEVRIALPKNARGIYHEKMGLFFDAAGHVVAFSGSSNETIGGLVSNYESIDVFCSWDDPQDRVAQKVHNFEAIWRGKTEHLEVMPFPKAVREKIIRLRPASVPHGSRVKATFSIPSSIRLRDYQVDASSAWFGNGGKGILEMATGSGKTITSLAIAVQLVQQVGSLVICIACPYQHLVRQWSDECARFGLKPVLAYRNRNEWEELLGKQVLEHNLGTREVVTIIVTHTTLANPAFTEIVSRIRGKALLIADEVHHLGAKDPASYLPDVFPYRMGLSATPERWMDAAGTARIRDYFGRTVYEYPLERAIKDGRLCPYYYYPILVELTEEEMEAYSELSERISRLFFAAEDDLFSKQRLEALLRQRALILNRAENKATILRNLLSQIGEVSHALFYCAPGQVNQFIGLLGNEMGLLVHPFTAEEDSRTRQQVLDSFAAGRLQGLVAIKCLDEGVDVPATRTAFIMASSSNPREFIQRRGRILRRAEGKQYATIYDLIAVPPNGFVSSETFKAERAIVRRELTRFREFCSAAVNPFEATEVILGLAKRYHVLDF